MIMSLMAIICWSSLFLISCSPIRAFTIFHWSQSSGVGFGIGGQKQWAADKTRFFAINVPPHFGVLSWWMLTSSENWNANRTVHGFVWGLTLHESGPPTLALLPIESPRGIQSMPTGQCQEMEIDITWNIQGKCVGHRPSRYVAQYEFGWGTRHREISSLDHCWIMSLLSGSSQLSDV